MLIGRLGKQGLSVCVCEVTNSSIENVHTYDLIRRGSDSEVMHR